MRIRSIPFRLTNPFSRAAARSGRSDRVLGGGSSTDGDRLASDGGATDTPIPPSGWANTLPPARSRSRWLFVAAMLGVSLVGGSWFAIRSVPWFGPMLADGLRAVLGSERVTQLEELVADVEDRVQRVASNGRARSLSESTPEDLLSAPMHPAAAARPDAPGLPAVGEPLSRSLSRDEPAEVTVTRPADVAPLYPRVASPEDGRWQAVPVRATSEPVLYRTILHPDAERAYAELFVFALDLSKVSVHAVAGSVEPRSPAGTKAARPGVVPERDRERLIAAFNGGFKAEHGHFGMMVDGTVLLAPKPRSCTFAALPDGELRIATWTALESDASRFSWWRQTPGCMVEDGVLHPGLRDPDSRNWGATLEGKTVIRRSAVGLSSDGRILFVGISNSTTARALALGMQRAGAVTVAQLDVNFSYPRFLLYREDEQSGELVARGAVKGLLYEPDEYLGRRSTRDFFYVTAR